jgi:urease accessory protein
MNHIQSQVQEDVKRIMSDQLRVPSTSFGRQIITKSDHFLMKPSFIASASVFGPKVILTEFAITW